MITVRFFLKNGTALPDVQCRDVNFKYSNLTGEVISYEIHGAFDTRPLYIDCKEIAAIYVMRKEGTDNG